MRLLALILLSQIRPTSARSVAHLHAASEYGAIEVKPPLNEDHLMPTETAAVAVEQKLSLKVPHPVGADAVAVNLNRKEEPNARIDTLDLAKEGSRGRNLPILRVEADPVELLKQPPPSDDVERDVSVLAKSKVLPGNEMLGESDRRVAQEDVVVFSDTLAQVKILPTVVAPAAFTATSAHATSAVNEATKDSKQLHKISAEEKSADLKEEGVIEYLEQEVDVMPSAKTILLKERKPKLISSISLGELQNGSLPTVISPKEIRTPATHVQQKLQLKSAEDEDSDAFPEFDEKADVDLEFHEDADAVTTSPSTGWTSSTPAAATEVLPASDIEDLTTEEEIYDLIVYLVTLLPDVEEPSIWWRIVSGLQCALRDCRRAFPGLTTVATPVGNGTFIIRRARSDECPCLSLL